MFKHLMTGLLAVGFVAGATIAASEPAQAGRGGRVAAGIAAGIIGLGLLGAYSHARDRHRRGYHYSGEVCYEGPEECGWVPRRCFENDWGERVCRGKRWKCWRDTYCD